MEKNRPTIAYIPPNLTESGGALGGIVNRRNLIEFVIFLVFNFFLWFFLSNLISTVLCVTGFLIMALIGGVPIIKGINGEPISVFILTFFTYRKSNKFLEMQMPMPEKVDIEEEIEEKPKHKRKMFKRRNSDEKENEII